MTAALTARLCFRIKCSVHKVHITSAACSHHLRRERLSADGRMHAVYGVQDVFATLDLAVSKPYSMHHPQQAYIVLLSRHAVSVPYMSLLVCMCDKLHKQIQNPSRSAELSPGVFQTSTRSARPAGLRSQAELCKSRSPAGWQSLALESRASEPGLPDLQGSAQHSSARSKPLQGFPVPRSLV